MQAILPRFEKLDPLHKVRLLMSALFLRPAALAAARPQLVQLAHAASTDDDEWVRVVGRAVGRYDGRLDLEAMVKDSSLVRLLQARVKDDNVGGGIAIKPHRSACRSRRPWPICDSGSGR